MKMPWTSALLLAVLPVQPTPDEFGAKTWAELSADIPDDAVLTAHDGTGRTITGAQYKGIAALLDEMDANIKEAETKERK